ncbi:hypothetical protein ACWGMK_13945 [Agrobacterium deltaense]
MTERGIKVVGAVTGANYGRLMRGNPTRRLEAMAKQRTAEAPRAALYVDNILANSVEEASAAGVTDRDPLEATDYYRTPGGQKPNGLNRSFLSHQAAAVGWMHSISPKFC